MQHCYVFEYFCMAFFMVSYYYGIGYFIPILGHNIIKYSIIFLIFAYVVLFIYLLFYLWIIFQL